MHNQNSSERKQATLYRMELPNHTCPFGVQAREQLERAGYVVDERLLTSREATDTFKAEHDVATTPQVFIDGKRIGGSEELEAWFARE